MTKAEMEHQWREYAKLIEEALSAEKRVDIPRVIELAEASWEHIDGMLRYEAKQRGQTAVALDGIMLVLRYAPILFDYAVLDRLAQFLLGKRRITNSASSDLDDEMSNARTLMWRAHAIWDQL